MEQRIGLLATVEILLLLTVSNNASGLLCHCSGPDCHEGSNTCDIDGGSCNIFIQGTTSGVLRVFENCLQGGFFSFNCNGALRVVPGASVPYSMCCKDSPFCNTRDKFYTMISDHLNETFSLPEASSTASSSTTIIAPTTESTTPRGEEKQPTISTTTSVVITRTYSISSSTSTSSSISPSPICRNCNTTITTSSTNVLIDSRASNGSGSPPAYAIGIIIVLAILLAVFIVVILVVIFLHFYPRHVIGAMSVESDGTPTCTLSTECGEIDDNLLKSGFEGTTSGSGSGLPQLIQRSVAAQVTLHDVIGKGRFGEVRKGVYKGDSVAVKIFHTKEEASWNHEVDIYQTCLIRHPNILRFIAADNKDMGIMTQLWLITEYCECGSLYDVLQAEPLSEDIVLKLCYTAASGLAHLHSDIIGTEGKPAIAHRDLKTRNILVKSDFSCCLADLGLSLRYYRDTDKVEEPPTKRVGTRRYLSPEILNDTMDINNFDCFKRSDMYSFGLVVWETAQRGICAGAYEDYQLPYFDLVNPDPSFEDIRKVVAFDKKRPTIPNRWSQSEVFHGLSVLMEQCWHHDGEARVTALRVKKNLSNLQSAKLKQMKTPITTAT